MILLPLAPEALPAILVCWGVFFTLDALSTRAFYREDPSSFPERESNPFLPALVGRLGFERGILAFLLAVELPLFLFASFTLHLFFRPLGPLAAPGMAAAMMAAAHAHGFEVNSCAE